MGARRKARKRAVDILYEADLRGQRLLDLLAARTETPGAQTPPPPYTAEIVRGVAAEQDRIDELIASYSVGWTLARMPAVDRSIARVATWEILSGSVPPAVAIDEAVDLARELSTDDSPGFLNGLLGRVATLHPRPLPPPDAGR